MSTPMEKLYTVEWEKEYPAHNLSPNWAVTRSLNDAFKLTNKLGETMAIVTPEEFAEKEGCSVELAKEGMLPCWENTDGTVKIEEYTEETAGPVRWKMLNDWLAAYRM